MKSIMLRIDRQTNPITSQPTRSPPLFMFILTGNPNLNLNLTFRGTLALLYFHLESSSILELKLYITSHHITAHSPSFCFPILDRDTRSRALSCGFEPPFFRSSRRSRALGKFWAVKKGRKICQLHFLIS